MQSYSVLMSVYKNDSANYLKLAIDSMIKQTIVPEQYVVVKDGPVGADIENVISGYKTLYPDMFTIVSVEENKGLANALNVGIQHCRNELIARMDADDISQPKRCEKILYEFENNRELVVCGCNIDEFYGESTNVKTSRVVPVEYESIKKFMRRRQPFNHPTVMYKKSKIIEVGGYLALKRKEDFDLFSRLLCDGCYVKNINESLYLYRADINNYMRRKSFVNFVSAVYVYIRHLKRGGCGIWDFLVICLAEFVFLLLPISVMKYVSDNVLRKRI